MGIYFALSFIMKNKRMSLSNFKLIVEHLNKAQLSYDNKKYFSKIETKKIITYMQKDKKNDSRKINLVLLKKIGVVELKKKFTSKQIQIFINESLMN